MEGVTFLRRLLGVIVFISAVAMLVLGVLGVKVMLGRPDIGTFGTGVI